MSITPILLYKLEFDDATYHLWHGDGNIELDGQIWVGHGLAVRVGSVPAMGGPEAAPLEITISGVDVEFNRRAVSEVNTVRGRPITLYMAAIGEDGQPDEYGIEGIYYGTMDQLYPASTETTRSLRLTCEGPFVDRSGAANALYSAQDQDRRYPGQNDRGLDPMPSLEGRRTFWPAA